MLFEPGLHIVAGDPSAGAPIIVMNIIRALDSGESVFGMPPEDPRPAAALFLGKSGANPKILEDAGIQILHDDHLRLDVFDRPEMEGIEVLAVDPAYLATPDATVNSNAILKNHMLPIDEEAKRRGIAVILSHYLSKSGSKSASAFDRVAGGPFWSNNTVTQTTVELVGDEDNPLRKIRMRREWTPKLVWECRVKRTTYWEDAEGDNPLDGWLIELPEGTEITSAEAIAQMKKRLKEASPQGGKREGGPTANHRNALNWLKSRADRGLLELVRMKPKALYRKPEEDSNV